ncbi:Ribonuclease P protein subunit p30 [Trichosporon asahii var. asahii CBS 2479]|uniref:Ribonuclease P protein subunit p30 n=1 Tax=Trichosporon asahii var. asahii (strain ATCC 90039 / CBS 2479 / JCM 2466 / KCTC 7840 / NBRC 103889/ NCYC 2677 / UAMH 7654) TaxID=1186058 RepID=J6FCD0_TRIAS|nr:Ribonuclease P protein subunit p30 [Trichosporon asahii var. asahii CBS 2479]EJT52752.1 Ribonuclease P protein subunit p30 [Trichosporon asahii var. asahii CBS 2479]
MSRGRSLLLATSPNVIPSPFGGPDDRSLPYPSLDPRYAELAGPSQPTLVQVTRYHMRLDDGKTATNTATLRDYDLLSVHVGCDKALQIACTDLANPGPNQIRQAQRNGVVIPYAAGLFPSKSVPSDIARRYRQNFLTNARELVRVTGGKDIIFTSGPGGAPDGIRGPLDVVNFATILGVPANLAKDAVSRTPKAVLLRAQARRTYKAVVSAPRLVPGPGEAAEEQNETKAVKDTTATEGEPNGNKADGKQKRPGDPAGGVKKKTKK